MEELKQLACFLASIKDDPRIGTAHISLYTALFQLYACNGFHNPILVSRSEVMKMAKINGLATYHKCLKDLVANGYLFYKPSFNPAIRSQVFL